MGFIGWIIAGIIGGWLAGVITRTDRNIGGDLVLGLIGAFAIGWVTDGAISGEGGLISGIIAAAIGAVILVLLKNWILGRRSA